MGLVEILQSDRLFAPSLEEAFIAYQLHAPVNAGRLEILARGKVVFTRTLHSNELGVRMPVRLLWDGKRNDGAFITPLDGPFEWRIVVDRDGKEIAARANLDVLYAGLRIRIADWTPDAKTPPNVGSSERKRMQYKLNELGYGAGVVGDETDDCLRRAVKRYRMNHPKFVQPSSNKDGLGDLDDEVMKAIEAGEGKMKFLEVEGGGTPLAKGKTTRILVEALVQEWEDTLSRAAAEAHRLTRPAFAVEAEVLLRTRDGKAAAAPEAVGAVRVNWRVKDVGENLSKQVLREEKAHPALARKYIKKARKEAGGLELNCPRSKGGIRTTTKPWRDAALIGGAYAAYPTTADDTKKAIVSRVYTGKKYKRRRGWAGFVFRPSYIAGDGYRISAELDFDDEPNAAELNARHDTISAETGTIRIWKRLRWAGIIRWTAKPKHKWPWKEIRDEYARAYVRLILPSKKAARPITDIIDTDDFVKALKGVGLSTKDQTLRSGGIWGAPLPKQGSKESWYSYESELRKLVQPFADDVKLKSAVGVPIRRGVLKSMGGGVVVIEFATMPRSMSTTTTVAERSSTRLGGFNPSRRGTARRWA